MFRVIFVGGSDMNGNEQEVTTVSNQVHSASRMKVKKIAFIGLMGAVSAVLMLMRFPIPFMPPFLSFDLSGVMEIMGGLMFGPVEALCIIVVKILLQLVMQGTMSLGTGELQNFLLSSAYVLPAVFIYHRKKTRKSAALGMAVSCCAVAVVAVLTNLYLIIPFYVKLFGMSMGDIIAMCNAVNPAMKDTVSLVIFGLLPFNLIKYGATSVVTFIIYKRLSGVIRGIINR